jgi:DNA-binding PadR family transcriptional regulator
VTRRSPLALTVLALLAYRPLHPYGLVALIKEWGKDEVVNVGQRASLYKTVRRLARAGLIRVQGTERDHQYPERTVYELTGEGRAAAIAWLEEMLSVPRYEFPEFPAALSFLMMVSPRRARELLERRLALLVDRVKELDTELAGYTGGLPRVALVETEYLRAVTAAEAQWVAAAVGDLRDGRLAWSGEEFRAISEGHNHYRDLTS